MFGRYKGAVQRADHTGGSGNQAPESALERALLDYADVAVGRSERHDPSLPRSGGPAGNARLTAWVGLVLLVASFVEGLTLVSIGRFLSWHIIVGTLLVPPALLKVATTSWRIGRYYGGHRPYISAGPPVLILRVVGPLVVLSTLGLLGSGLALVALGPEDSHRSLFDVAGVAVGAITLHQAFFFVWVAAMVIHVLGRLVPALVTVAGRQRIVPLPGRAARGGVMVGMLAATALAGVLVVGASHSWTSDFHHRQPGPSGQHRLPREHP